MKTLIVLLLTVILFSYCKKEDIEPDIEPNNPVDTTIEYYATLQAKATNFAFYEHYFATYVYSVNNDGHYIDLFSNGMTYHNYKVYSNDTIKMHGWSGSQEVGTTCKIEFAVFLDGKEVVPFIESKLFYIVP